MLLSMTYFCLKYLLQLPGFDKGHSNVAQTMAYETQQAFSRTIKHHNTNKNKKLSSMGLFRNGQVASS